MDNATYSSIVKDINDAVKLVGVTTLTFTVETNKTIGSTTYSNLISYSGYYLESLSQKLIPAISVILDKYGKFSSIKRPYVSISTPANPSGDHYTIIYGYYVAESDLDPNLVKEENLKKDISTTSDTSFKALKDLGPKYKLTTKNESLNVTIGEVDPTSKERVVTVSISVTYDSD